jgi:hypothetical protein
MNEKDFIKFKKQWDKRKVPHGNKQPQTEPEKNKNSFFKIGVYSLLAVLSLSAPIIIFPLIVAFLLYDLLIKKVIGNFDVFYSNKVANHMFEAGVKPQDMPPNNLFKPMCDALKAREYNADEAATLWVKCIRDNDTDAIKELRDHTGAYGIMMFGND